MSATRSERDSLGTVEVPADAYYGAQTQRARDNFPISGYRMSRRFIEALGLIKAAAAAVHRETGALPRAKADAIELSHDRIGQRAVIAMPAVASANSVIRPTLRRTVGRLGRRSAAPLVRGPNLVPGTESGVRAPCVVPGTGV